MRALNLCLLLLLGPNRMTAQTDVTTLAALRDQARPLLIFGRVNDPRIEQQYADLAAHAVEARDRDMRVGLVTASHTHMHDGTHPPEADFDPAEQAHLRHLFHIAPGEFAVILVGKDGGEKLRSAEIIPWKTLSATIDGMPMRRDEMKGK